MPNGMPASRLQGCNVLMVWHVKKMHLSTENASVARCKWLGIINNKQPLLESMEPSEEPCLSNCASQSGIQESKGSKVDSRSS